MNISRTNSQVSVGLPAPTYIPHTPAQAAAAAAARLEKGFVREAVKPRGNGRLLRQLVRQQESRQTWEEQKEFGLSGLLSKSANPADAFCFLLTHAERKTLRDATGSTPDELTAFQNLISGKPFCLNDAQAFATKWSELPRPHEKTIGDLPGYALLDRQATALATSSGRINFVHSDVDFQTHSLNPAYDLKSLVCSDTNDAPDAPSEVVGLLNPASRSGWGKSGASRAIQDGAEGTAFEHLHKALYKDRTNLVGNAPVGQACVVPVREGKVVFSVAGPNHKHHTGLRIKLPRLSHLLKPSHVSKSQESKLRAAYRTFFALVDQYNADAGLTGQDAIKKLHMVPISANVFGFPKDKAARIMTEEILRYTAQNPDIRIQVLAVNDDVLAGHVTAAFDSVGATSTTDGGIPKQD